MQRYLLSLVCILPLACNSDDRSYAEGTGAGAGNGGEAGSFTPSAGNGGAAGSGSAQGGAAGSANGGAAALGGSVSGGTGGSGGSAGVGTAGTAGSGNAGSCLPNPCENGASCGELGGAPVCECTGGFTGPTCSTRILEWAEGAGCRAEGVSGDGTVVVGSCEAGGQSSAFRWSGSSIEPLPTLSGGTEAAAFGANHNGLVIVGWSEDSSGNTAAARWVNGTVSSFQQLATLEFFSNRALRTSADGGVAVGVASRAGEYDTGVRWTGTATAPTNLAASQGHQYSFATGVSADGSTAVGYGTDEGGAFVWTSAAGYSALTGIEGAQDNVARGVSADGQVVVGASNGVATRWVGGAPSSLGSVGTATAASSDGELIAGRVGNEAFVWTSASGVRTLSLMLSELGVEFAGFSFATATDVSADGRVVVGYGSDGTNERAFRVTLPE